MSDERTVSESTPLIHMATGEYPLFTYDVRRREGVVMAREPLYANIIELGYGIVEPSDPPVADVVTAGDPVETAEYGVYKQGWNARPYTEEERLNDLRMRKDMLLNMVDYRKLEALERGYERTFQDGTVGHVQLRDTDRINLIGERIFAKEQIEAGNPTEIFVWHLREKITVEMMAEEMVAVADECRLQYRSVLLLAMQLEMQINAATTKEELPEVPLVLASQASA